MRISKRDILLENRIIKQRNRILEINTQNQIDDICGTLSACFALEYLGLDFDINLIIKNAKDGTQMKGADPYSLAYAISKNPNVKVIVNFDYDGSELDANDKDSIDKFNASKNTYRHKSISIQKVLRRYTKVSIPIVGFWRNGENQFTHFSPLVGKTSKELHFILDDSEGIVRPQLEEFKDRNWWNAENGRTSIIIRKSGLINCIKYHFFVTRNYLYPSI